MPTVATSSACCWPVVCMGRVGATCSLGLATAGFYVWRRHLAGQYLATLASVPARINALRFNVQHSTDACLRWMNRPGTGDKPGLRRPAWPYSTKPASQRPACPAVSAVAAANGIAGTSHFINWQDAQQRPLQMGMQQLVCQRTRCQHTGGYYCCIRSTAPPVSPLTAGHADGTAGCAYRPV
jgi:hypothetical protein